ncbi:MAG: asparagine synthase-related protein [Thiohalospira sp.]
MQSIFGKIFFRDNTINEKDVISALKELAFGKELKQSFHCKGNYGFGATEFFSTKYNTIDQSLWFEHPFLVIGDCRIDNRESIIKKLNLENQNISENELILRCFQQWKTDCPKYLTGDFSFAIWNVDNKELFCARDHFGVKPFNYYVDDNQFIFSTEIRGILSQQNLNLTIDQQFIADTLSIIKSEHFRSTFNEIKKLPPAHYLHLKNKKLTISPYWKLKPLKISLNNESEYLAHFKKLLFQAVERRLKDSINYGTELSGGIDSSTITSIVSQNVPVKTFSHVMPDNKLGKIHPFKDEKKYIGLLTDFCKIKERFYITSENSGIIDALENSLSLNKCIVQQNFSAFSDQLYQTAGEQNIQVLFSGFGGDEVVTSKSGNYLTEILSYKQLKKDLKNQGFNFFKIHLIFLKKLFKSFFPKLTNTVLSLIKGKKWWVKKYKNLALCKSFNESMDIKPRYFNYYKNIKKENLVNQSIERISHQHVAQRLEYSSLAARRFGIEYRYPLLDKDLIEFYLSMPPRLKARNGILRYTIRRAMEGFLPDEIRWRNDKSGATIPTVFMRAMYDKNTIIEIIQRAKSNPKINYYIDMDKYEKWCNNFFQRSQNNKFINPGAFFNYLKLILFIQENPSLFE